MSITSKSGTLLLKRDLTTGKTPAVGFKKLFATHVASSGDTGISLLSLNQAPSMPYSNSSAADIASSNLSQFPEALTLISSVRGTLQLGLSYTVTATRVSFVGFTALAGELFTLVIDPVAKTGVNFVDAAPLVSNGVLAIGLQEYNVGQPFEVNKYPLSQVGAVLVFVDGVLQHRNVGNATAAPGADGNYQEINAASNLGTIIKFNTAEAYTRNIMVVSNGLLAERPYGSIKADLERQQGQLDKLVEVVSDVSGLPESSFQSAPNSVDLKAFGDRVLTLESTKLNKLGRTDGSNPASTDIGYYTEQVRLGASGLTWVSNTPLNVTASPLALDPGDWDIWAVVSASASTTTTVDLIQASISTTSASLTAFDESAAFLYAQAAGTVLYSVDRSTLKFNIAPVRVSIAAATNYYLVFRGITVTSGSGLIVYGKLCARRRS